LFAGGVFVRLYTLGELERKRELQVLGAVVLSVNKWNRDQIERISGMMNMQCWMYRVSHKNRPLYYSV